MLLSRHPALAARCRFHVQLAVLFMAYAVGGPGVMAQAPAPAAGDYVRWPKLGSFTVAPSNRHAAFLMVNEQGRRVVAVIDLENPSSLRVVAGYADGNVVRVAWVNDRRLIYEAYLPGARIDRGGAGTFAVDLDGGRPRQLINWFPDSETTGSHIRTRVLNYGWRVWRAWDQRGDEVLAHRALASGVRDHGAGQLVRMDTVTGAMQNPSFDQPPFADSWTFDGQGDLRMIGAGRDGRQKLYLRASGKTEWTEIEDQPRHSDQQVHPLYIEGDGTVIVLSRRGRDTYALFTYDPRNKTLGAEPLAAATGFDVGGDIDVDNQARQVVGVHLHADRVRSVWFDAGLAAVQQAVDSALPKDRHNRLICGNCLSARHLVVRSAGDRIHAEYFVYDRKAQSLRPLGAARPWLPESTQGARSFHRVSARDGLSLPVVVTHPPGREQAGALPAVLLVHGGPWLRGTDLAWDLEAQFLASRGYRVIEVDFRGSTGLGWKHFQAGFKQWGLAMQDDLADIVGWAVRQGSVDGQRVCIVGSSYGGYAALMGPVRHPGTYRCAASHAGLTDLELMVGGSGSDVAAQHLRFTYPALVGDPKTEAEMLRRQSPLHRVADMKVPVLLAQGGLDQRVTKEHADRFESAARAAGVAIERVDYPHDAHGWFEPASHADFLQRLERFLAHALKPR